MKSLDLLGKEINEQWGGKRQNSGRPTIKEKRRIITINQIIKEEIKREEKYLKTPPNKQGAHRIHCEFLKKIKHLID